MLSTQVMIIVDGEGEGAVALLLEGNNAQIYGGLVCNPEVEGWKTIFGRLETNDA